SRYAICRALLEFRSNLVINERFERGLVAASSALYFAENSRYEEAIADYQFAIGEFEAHAHDHPDSAETYNKQGLALTRLGEIFSELSRFGDSAACYRSGIAA